MLISAIGQGRGFFGDCEAPRRSATELGLFLDAPWGNIVKDRQGDIMLERLYPRGGLLGGSGGPLGKTSKLAALAKARKEKSEAQKREQQQSLEGEKRTAVSMLSRLSQKQSPPPALPIPKTLDILPAGIPKSPVAKAQTPPQTGAPNKPSPSLDQSTRETPEERPQEEFVPALDLRAGPSKFAVSMFGDRITSSYEIEVTDARMFSLPGVPLNAQGTAFTGPSPDDIVAAAQNSSKGSDFSIPQALLA